LQRAEWIKFVAPFFNKELEANKKFADIKTSYEKTVAAVKANPSVPTNSVAWVAWSSYAGPGVVVYTTPFKDQYIKVSRIAFYGATVTKGEIVSMLVAILYKCGPPCLAALLSVPYSVSEERSPAPATC
jgi:ABC-type Fe3+-hydroxamate transport system substrate-binding protein